MTSSVNGIGTHLSGSRDITKEEYEEWSKKMPYIPGLTHHHLKIATRSFVLLFLPLIPLETVVYYYVSRDKYRELFYPAGKGKVLWTHVFNNPVFYAIPFIILIILIMYFL